MVKKKSAYRELQEQFPDQDKLYQVLCQRRYESPDLWLGYLITRDQIIGEKRTQTQIAELLGVSHNQLSNVLAGRSGFSPDNWAEIARIYGASPIEGFIANGWIGRNDIQQYIADQQAGTLLLPSEWATIIEQLEHSGLTNDDKAAVLRFLKAAVDLALEEKKRNHR